jgi:hypothetical protein
MRITRQRDKETTRGARQTKKQNEKIATSQRPVEMRLPEVAQPEGGANTVVRVIGELGTLHEATSQQKYTKRKRLRNQAGDEEKKMK